MVDSDHAGDKQTRRSHTGFFIYCNMALIIWLSKRQLTIETSVFGAKFVAWSTASKCWGDWDTNCEWWGFPWPDLPLSMGTTNPKWQTHPDLSRLWRRNAIQFATMQSMNRLPWANLLLLIFELSLILLTSWPKWPMALCAIDLLAMFFLTSMTTRPSMFTLTSKTTRPTNDLQSPGWSWGDWGNMPEWRE